MPESSKVKSKTRKCTKGYEEQQKTRDKWLQQFTIAFGTDEGDETTTFDGTITQTLMMFNGELIKQAISGKPGSFLHDTIHDSRSRYAGKIQRLFLASLARRATQSELKMTQQLLASYSGDENKALEDIWWALLNSNQFILNH